MKEITAFPDYVTVGTYLGDTKQIVNGAQVPAVIIRLDDNTTRIVLRTAAMKELDDTLIGKRIAVDRSKVNPVTNKRVTRVFLLEDGEHYEPESDDNPFTNE